jgi:hypothetical protein
MLALLAPVVVAASSWQPQPDWPRGRPPTKFRLTTEQWQAVCPALLQADEIETRGAAWKPRRRPSPDFPS